jgi:hypothetical protein
MTNKLIEKYVKVMNVKYCLFLSKKIRCFSFKIFECFLVASSYFCAIVFFSKFVKKRINKFQIAFLVQSGETNYANYLT